MKKTDDRLYQDKLVEEYEAIKMDMERDKDKLKYVKSNYRSDRKKYKSLAKEIMASGEGEDDDFNRIRDFHLNRRYILLSEIFNSITHGIGVALGILATILLLIKASSGVEYLAYSIYGASVIILFLASTLYHSLSFTGAKHVFRIIDHSSIFIMIAGSYTPYLLLSIGGTRGLRFFYFIWIVAFLGILFKVFLFEKSTKIGTVIYVLMGWLVVVMMKDLLKVVDIWGIVLLAIGGVLYTGGLIFYGSKKIKYAHVIWHLFVFAAALMMFLSIYLYL